ncbi:MAG: biotin/lipoyl-containing protein [Prevotella sp.]|nr:acetyl-CoA carboxylase biotin carboxyl carrier protein subunit [Prevotella sp.]MCI5570338.1 acetyl-CoA carboxylase biotin carboxyl carrier protein subunit [Prevotella sp.]MCI6370910.1 acetyl-CoA carboxylase biotin carboxyl carrier protein subunit [Prevotella sp.]MCI6402618.1 acetyl-CoA carboxylase biotin carboxyl carrier protein subunit [Prevotella sp.]MCI6448628.1 acetyl-CoA carboxylase biotin carboxyl carrier protein subunit [Prevotella sp.]
MAKYQYTIQGVDYDVEINEVEGSLAKVNVNGIDFDVELKQPISVGKQMKKVKLEKPVAAPVTAAAPGASPVPAPVEAGSGAKVLAPLPGTVTEVCVKVGDAVAMGDTVVVLEAMKMQNNIEAENSGTVTSVLVSKGDTVMEGAPLITIG